MTSPSRAPLDSASFAKFSSSAIEAVHNGATTIEEALGQFRRANPFSRAKVAIIAAWGLVVLAAVVVAFSQRASKATITVGDVAGESVYMVANESSRDWRDVTIVVNGRYRKELPELKASGGRFVVTPTALVDEKGKRAPNNLVITDIDVRVRSPEATYPLLSAGIPTSR